MTPVFKQTTNLETLEVDQECMVLHADQFTVTKLNEVGGICWSLLKEAQTVQSLAEELQRRFDITQDEAEGDVRAFLEELTKLGLVEHAG
jgi:hypothetical protein